MSADLSSLVHIVSTVYNSKYQNKNNESVTSSVTSTTTQKSTPKENKKLDYDRGNLDDDNDDKPLIKNTSLAKKQKQKTLEEQPHVTKSVAEVSDADQPTKNKSKYKLDSSSEDLSKDGCSTNINEKTVEDITPPVIENGVVIDIPPSKRIIKKVEFPDNFVDALATSNKVIRQRTEQDLQQNLTDKNPHRQYYDFLINQTSTSSMISGSPLVIIDVLSQLLAKFGDSVIDEDNQKKTVDLTKEVTNEQANVNKSSDMVNILRFIKSFVTHLEKQEESIRAETNADQLHITQQKVDSACLSSRPTSTIVSLNENDQIARQFAKATTFSMASLPSMETLTRNYTNLANAYHNKETSLSTQSIVQLDLDTFVKAFISAKNSDLICIKLFNDYLDEHEIPIDMTSIPDNCIKFLTNRTYGGAEAFKSIITHLNLCVSFVILVLHYYLIAFYLITRGKFESMAEVRNLRARAGVNKYVGQDEENESNISKNKRRPSRSSSKRSTEDDDDIDDDDISESNDDESDDDDKNNKYDPAYLAADDDANSIVYQNDDDFKPTESQASDDDFDDAESSSE